MLTDIDVASLKPFFEPESIAILGASSDSAKPSGRAQIALMNKGYKGNIYPVNPKYQEIFGLKCYPSLADVPGKVDLVIISIPAEGVCAALEQCIAKGVRAAVIFSSGFAEIGPEGRLLQEKMTELARGSGIRLCGPNCVGVINTNNGVRASFAFVVDIPDVDPRYVGFVTQSGAFGALIYAQALAAGVGFNYFVSTGNEADAEFADFLGYMIRDRSTKLVGGYLEGAKDGRKLRRVAEEAVKAQKPIMIMKVGRSTAGARAASSHTGSLAGVDRIYDAFFKQTGIIRIDGPEEMIAFAPLISAGRLPRGKNIVILTTSGGTGVTLADACEKLGFTLPMLNESTRAKMEAVLPSFASVQNPIDLTGQYMTHPQILVTCFNALVEDDNVDIILANFNLAEPYGVEIARRIIDIYNSTGKTIVIFPWVLPGADEGDGVRELRRAGLPVLIDRNLAVRALAHLADYAGFLRKRENKEYEVPVSACSEHSKVELNGLQGVLSEGQSKDLLARFGIPVTREGLARSEDEAVRMAGQIGYPVVLKVDSPDIPHKTDAGALMLNLASEEEVRKAYSTVLQNAGKYKPDARINGVLVQEMLPQGIEVIIGVTRDPVFGPTIMFGLGGIFVEVLKDVSFRVAPLSPGDALDMIREIKGYQVLKGTRGKPPADVDALVNVIMKVSAMVTELKDRIEELDINPLMVYPAKMGAKAADAMVVLRR
ncbi:acetate--CoA ligase family protein [Desulfallas sp. Bu1-1]|uniref:acetate--CoA ligase family protein n=1 Tax=Desulfallas sp. Bu1-1 TaxID=2787620 RepID=UPI00189F4B07|nr:acetate--CoA ligase family protein [Desulfallas sp. Bu1-1]MBF7084704.1 acetate--CoA ligase family protein [Desulfallas sp. Bu1-1]